MMTPIVRGLGTSIVLGALLFLNLAPVGATVVVPPPPTQPSGSPPTSGSGGGGTTSHPTPEPATIVSALVGTAAAGLFAWRRRRARLSAEIDAHS